MTKDCLLHWARRHLRWLLCFALLLPAAQLAGAVHAFSHLNASTQQRDPGAPADVHCSICAVAAAVGAGGLPSTPLVLPADATPARRVLPAPLRAVHAAPQRRLANRGPPLLLA
jgi:hypothetical protein